MTYLTAFGRVVPDGLVATPTGADGVWLVHRPGQRPAEGVAVWRYPYGYRCERDGATHCIHLDAVLRQSEGTRYTGETWT